MRAEKVAEGLRKPTHVVAVPGRARTLLVVEQAGRIRVVRAGSVLRRPFLDIRGSVSVRGPEQGLLSLAFAPDYERSGRFYVYFSDRADDIRVVEFTRASSTGDLADPGSARLVLRIPHPLKPTPGEPPEDLRVHYGGQLAFGPDGALYVGVGDGGGQGDPHHRAQDLGLLAGKLLRIRPRPEGGRRYGIPPDNPFAGERSARPEIFAYGLRNPYRFSFDRHTGDLVIGDVGQYRIEEINYLPAGHGGGANFGWSCFEGRERFKRCQAQQRVDPVIERPSSGVVRRCAAITGGYVVRDPALEALRGRYLYADFCDGKLRSAVLAGGEARDDRELGLTVPWPSSFGEDERGRIYVTSYQRGEVYRLVPQRRGSGRP